MSSKKILAFGTFDILHPGHESFLNFARKHEGVFTVVIARDSTVEKLKKRKPVHSELERKQAVEHLEIADQVILGDEKDHLKVIREIRPDVIVLGYDQIYFADTLRADLDGLGLEETQIIRAPAYFPERYKSSILQKQLSTHPCGSGDLPGIAMTNKQPQAVGQRPSHTQGWEKRKAANTDFSKTRNSSLVTRHSSSPEQTKSIAAKLASEIQTGDIYLLRGELGAGKTCFTQGFLEAIGINEKVTSPTYVYQLTYHHQDFKIHHLDLYRVVDGQKLLELGIEEIIHHPQDILFIEWPEILLQNWKLPLSKRVIEIEIIRNAEKDIEREIKVTFHPSEG